MLSQTNTLWHYLGSFVLYTLVAIGLIYGAYWYSRRAAGGFLGLARKEDATKGALKLESSLSLEPNKTLYVVRSGEERFLIAASGDGTQLLSKLEPETVQEPEAPARLVTVAERPWYTEGSARFESGKKVGFGARFVQSVQWLVSSRTRIS